MSPVAITKAEDAPVASVPAVEKAASAKSAISQTRVLYRTPDPPPITRSAHGPYYLLEDGREIIDAVGGAAVTCIGNGHPRVVQAVKDQVEKLSCAYDSLSLSLVSELVELADAYQVQLTNGPAEELAGMLIESGKGAFAQCGFVSGGMHGRDDSMHR